MFGQGHIFPWVSPRHLNLTRPKPDSLALLSSPLYTAQPQFLTLVRSTASHHVGQGAGWASCSPLSYTLHVDLCTDLIPVLSPHSLGPGHELPTGALLSILTPLSAFFCPHQASLHTSGAVMAVRQTSHHFTPLPQTSAPPLTF